MNWNDWQPRERANLCFIVKDGRVLLIHKKRGLGARKINAPGGKIEPGETALEAAIRETREEVGVTPLEVTKAGELFFQFTDGYSLFCHVFRAEGCDGEPMETAEAVPIWTDLNAIPYHAMWADDEHWLPLLLRGDSFRGWFQFDGDTMMLHRVAIVSAHQREETTPWLEY